jgi:hypothetical protein
MPEGDSSTAADRRMIHTDIRLAQRDISRILDDLALFLENDEQFKLSTLEGETDLFEIASKLLDANADDEGLIASLDQRISDINIRKDRAKLRIERRKSALVSLMDCAQIKKLPLPEATVSLRTILPRPKVVDVDALPESCVNITEVRKPDMVAIEALIERGQQIPGVTMTNGAASLSVRRK